jgi:glycosyltransferase involved in cell wall biosynthesis
MKNILITAYAVNPYKGSEDGTGWKITTELSTEHQLTVITRKNNIPDIQKYLEDNPDHPHRNTRFIGYDLPDWIMNWKHRLGERGYALYFYLWQWFLPRFIKRQELKFDLAHALNFHSDSHPHFLWKLRKPTVWGPIGHHPRVPESFLYFYGKNSGRRDKAYNTIKDLMRRIDPFFRKAVRKTDHIFGINSTIEESLPAKPRSFSIMPAVGADDPGQLASYQKEFKVLSIGRFVYMKGFDLSIRAFDRFIQLLPEEKSKECKLQMIGAGEKEQRLRALSAQLGIQDRIEWISWVPFEEMGKLYASAQAFLFPSHEGAGMVVPEAMSYGLPVITLDNEGPGELLGEAGFRSGSLIVEKVAQELSDELLHLFHDKQHWMKRHTASREGYEARFQWKKKAQRISAHYAEILDEKAEKVAVFHPSGELYGADRILVNALESYPEDLKIRLYLFQTGPLVDFVQQRCPNVEVIHDPSMPTIYRAIFHPIGILKFARSYFRFRRYMKNEHRVHRFRSAYVNTLSNVMVLPVLRSLGIRNFIHVHEIIDSPKVIGRFCAEMALRFSDHVLCVSQAVANGLLGYRKDKKNKIAVLRNGIDPIDSAVKPLNGRLNFYLFGRIKPEKGQWYLLDALDRIPREKLENAHFTLMGGVLRGQEHLETELKERLAKNQLEDKVEIRDFAPNISEAMSEADVCLVPSLMKDPFPTTVLEAMSCGRPVIVTDHGGAKEAMQDGDTGFLIPPNQPEAFAERIMTVIEQKDRIPEWSKNCIARYQSHFTKEVFHRNWSEMLGNAQMI